jgi:hypothetical protein
MHVREGTKRKDACLNAESSITGSRILSQFPRRRLFLFEVYIDCQERDTTSMWEKFTNTTETELPLRKPVPQGTEKSRARHGSAGKEKGQRNQVPFRGRHNRLA